MDRNGFRLVTPGLFDEQRGVVARRQTDQPDAIGQVFGHLDGAGADGAGAAEQDDVFHEGRKQKAEGRREARG